MSFQTHLYKEMPIDNSSRKDYNIITSICKTTL